MNKITPQCSWSQFSLNSTVCPVSTSCHVNLVSSKWQIWMSWQEDTCMPSIERKPWRYSEVCHIDKAFRGPVGLGHGRTSLPKYSTSHGNLVSPTAKKEAQWLVRPGDFKSSNLGNVSLIHLSDDLEACQPGGVQSTRRLYIICPSFRMYDGAEPVVVGSVSTVLDKDAVSSSESPKRRVTV